MTFSVPDLVTGPTLSAAQILKQYTPESSFFFASPTRTLIAQGSRAEIQEPNRTTHGEGLAEHVTALLEASRTKGHGLPLAVGAVPFDDASPAYLLVPKTVQSAGPLNAAAAPLRPEPRPSIHELRRYPEPHAYVRGVEQAVAQMRAGAFAKVVLSRMLEMTLKSPVDLQLVLRRLSQLNRNGYTFAANLPHPAARMADSAPGGPAPRPRTLVGASPELLLSRSGLSIVANPLAGSAVRSADPDEDQRRASALLASKKDRHEHAIVVDAVAAALRPFCRRLNVPEEPSLTQTPILWHLSTRVTGELHDLSISSLKLATALHPTPAVCGHPVERARKAISELEPFRRGFFTGLVGWCDASGDGEWAVVIRCADIAGRSVRLYAGAGIVVGSDGEHELAETSAKLRTMLNALGLDQAPEVM